jgi:hypothetical protein
VDGLLLYRLDLKRIQLLVKHLKGDRETVIVIERN